MDPIAVIHRFYAPGCRAAEILIHHGRQVAGKAMAIAGNLADRHPDTAFIEQAALLHDIGMGLTRAPSLGCTGIHPYICHGYLGRNLLESIGLERHGRVCERHVGLGLSVAEIDRQKLPLPRRDMRPRTLEEKIVCFADKFFSKTGDNPTEKPIEAVLESLRPLGGGSIGRFLSLAGLLRYEL